MADDLLRVERIEPELVAATSHFGQNAEFHPTKARMGEELPDHNQNGSGHTKNSYAFTTYLEMRNQHSPTQGGQFQPSATPRVENASLDNIEGGEGRVH